MFLISLVPRPPPFFVLRFAFSFVYYTERKPKNKKNGGGLGTRLVLDAIADIHANTIATSLKLLCCVQYKNMFKGWPLSLMESDVCCNTLCVLQYTLDVLKVTDCAFEESLPTSE